MPEKKTFERGAYYSMIDLAGWEGLSIYLYAGLRFVGFALYWGACCQVSSFSLLDVSDGGGRVEVSMRCQGYPLFYQGATFR